MTPQSNTSLAPREATPSAASRLFSFYRVRSGSETRFFPAAGARLHFASKDTDTLSLPGLPVGLLAAGDSVVVRYKGVTVFRGDVEKRVRHWGRGDKEFEDVVCCGPWSKMARLVYRQYWAGNNTYYQSSRIILNQYQTNSSDASNGTPQNLNSELAEIVNHAKTACGYQKGTISVSTQKLPFDEVRDITVADAIRRELRFFPKAVVRFDYSTTPPTLSIERVASPSDASYLASVPKTARRREYVDHPITGVYIEIETIGDGYRSLSHQSAGSTSPGNPDCLYATLQLAGAEGSTVTQSFKSVTEEIPANLDDKNWWISKHPRLANVAASTLAITAAARSGASDASRYPRISSSTAGELEAAGLRCRVEEFTCQATITTADDVEESIYLSMKFLTTNAETKTYNWVVSSSSSAGETVPSGLAAAILADRSGALRSERVTMRLGDAWPVLGDAAGGLFLQSFDVDCLSLVAELNFGAPDYLAPEDMAALLSGFRNKRRPSTAFSRSSGKPADDNASKTEVGSIPPVSSTEFAPGTKAKTVIGGSSTGKIKLDPSSLSSSDVIAVRTVTVPSASGGASSQVKVLASEDFAIPAGGTAEVPEMNYVTGISFEISNGYLNALVTKKNSKTQATVTNTAHVCKVHDENVVIDTAYSSPNFTQSKQTVTVIGEAPASGGGTQSTVFETHNETVVIDTAYNSPNFTQSKQTVTVIGESPASGGGTQSTVFTTTPHSQE